MKIDQTIKSIHKSYDFVFLWKVDVRGKKPDVHIFLCLFENVIVLWLN